MENPEYRIATYCPHGISTNLQGYLNQPSSHTDGMLIKDTIALRLIDNFAKSKLPFAGVFLGWATPHFSNKKLADWLNVLSRVKTNSSNEIVSLESFTNSVEGGVVAIGAFYPLLDLSQEHLETEYRRISFLINKQTTDELLNWAYQSILKGALQHDRIGAICVILGDGGDIAEKKIQESVGLLQEHEPSL